MAGEAWSDDENDAIVADYFDMLADDVAARPYNKAAHNRALQGMIGRGKGSIEFKHQNISAVMKALGMAWIEGYKPAFNFQSSLVDAVARRLASADLPPRSADVSGVADASPLWVGPPPTLRNTPPPDEAEQMDRVARKFDVAGRDERNRKLGAAGEARVLAHEQMTLNAAGRTDLARDVRWISKEDGDGAGYDIASFAPDGTPRLIEVKTTNGWERTPFYISRNELAVSNAEPDHWVLFRLFDFARRPRAYELRPPLSAHVALVGTSYEARLH